MNEKYKEAVRAFLRKNKGVTGDEYLLNLSERLKTELDYWNGILEAGANDPFWPDGVSMNLTRDHIIHNKMMILAVCDLYQLTIPAIYYMPTPPEVEDDYDAKAVREQLKERRSKAGKKQKTLERLIFV
jgi:hypothetical protein